MTTERCWTEDCPAEEQLVRINEWHERFMPSPWWNPAHGHLDTAGHTIMILSFMQAQMKAAEALLFRGRTAGQDWTKGALDAENYLHKCIAEWNGVGE